MFFKLMTIKHTKAEAPKNPSNKNHGFDCIPFFPVALCGTSGLPEGRLCGPLR